MKTLLLLGLAALSPTLLAAQTTADSAATTATKPLTGYGFVDGYYGYDFTGQSQTRPGFLYSHSRANEFALNNVVLGLRYQDERVRGAVALHTGTYVEANYAAEPAVLRHVYEAYAGFRPFHKAWLDVGIFSSHIGFESALSKDNWTLTRSIMAENSPYYESGARLSYEVGPKLTLTGLVLNGWQNLRETNRAKALGWQLQWKPTDKLLLNSSSFYGNEQPRDSARRRRYFHDLYLSYAATDRLSLAAVFDVGAQQRSAGQRGTDTWYAGTALARYQFSPKWAAAARYEFYRAERGVVIRSLSPLPTDADFRVGGGSVNVDYAPAANVLVRVEGRVLRSPNRPFANDAEQPTTRYANVTSSVALSF
ncbi:porin [Hymenobacter sp. CRA2]|uniref:porin n=1 Tax=Hymenobacter sp. CRA2 TaxID=1955620 RepID=UPI00098EA7B6|nr:porin [Hymenobacter sp. CRA2]OON66483.1 hypothetical protein B0919_21880 [Hymenobacter sp. CRA2]